MRISSANAERNLSVLQHTIRAIFSLLTVGLAFASITGCGPAVSMEAGSAGKTILVRKGGDFQAALEEASAGDTIKLEAGASFHGPFTLPRKDGDQFVTIRSSAPDGSLPQPDERVIPEKHSASMPKLGSSTSEAVITSEPGAHHYKFLGVEFTSTKEGAGNIIKLGSTAETKIEDLPHHIEFDRVYIHGDPKLGQRRGIAANGKFIKILNSHISDIKRKGEESQAIAIWATNGPIEIVNNYLEAAAENILFGGADSALGLIPSDCIIYGNHLNKPTDWRSQGWVVKNLFEIKSGRRIKVQNNLMTNNWGMGQDGTAILFTTKTDSGHNAVIEDVDFSGNIVRGSGGGLSINGGQGNGGRRLTITNNIFDQIDGAAWNSSGHFMKSTEWDALTIADNTIIQTGSISKAYGEPINEFIFRNNIIFENKYGLKGDSTAAGLATIERYFPKAVFTNNIIVGGSPDRYPRGNFHPVSVRQIGFSGFESGDYSLRKDSPYLTRGHDGGPVGARVDPNAVGKGHPPR